MKCHELCKAIPCTCVSLLESEYELQKSGKSITISESSLPLLKIFLPSLNRIFAYIQIEKIEISDMKIIASV